MNELILSVFFVITLFTPVFNQNSDDNWIFHNQKGDGWFGSVVKDYEGNIIVGGGGGNSHFRVFDGNTWQLYLPENFDVDFGFYGTEMAIDKNNVLWLAQGNSDGLTSWDGKQIKNYNTSNSNINSNSIFGVGVGSNNEVWHTRRQSFDGSEWGNSYSDPCSDNGGNRKVHVTRSNDVWITGGSAIGIESGEIFQPCITLISADSIKGFHLNEGHNLPQLTASGGYHLISELTDGTILVFASTPNGIEVKEFNGTDWENYDLFKSDELGNSALYDIWTDNDNSIWLCGQKNNVTSQIIHYCNGTWAIYNLPEDKGFPSAFFGIIVDNGILWAVGSVGICMLELAEESCKVTGVIEPAREKSCESATIVNDNIILSGCHLMTSPLSYKLINSSGSTVRYGTISTDRIYIGELPSSVYFLQLQRGSEYNIFKLLKN